jgi:hybrid polyketide synthase/nonribosomal peptide synthetase ACE1
MTFDDDGHGVETLFAFNNIAHGGDIIRASFSYHSAVGKETDVLTLMATGKVEVILGESSNTLLPSKTSKEPNMTDVDADRFYQSLSDLGYGYSGPFRTLSLLKRKFGKAAGLVFKPAYEDSKDAMIVHPAMLDTAFQAVILAYCSPNDGRLWSLHVPTAIRRIRVNPSMLAAYSGREVLFPFDATLPHDEGSGIYGDVDIFPEIGEHAMLQVEGISCVPFSSATPATDSQLFSTMIWDYAVPNGEAVGWDCRATVEEYDLAYIAERVSLFYLRNLDRVMPQDHPARISGPYKGMFGFAKHVISSVSTGRHPYAKKEWEGDTLDQILALSKRWAKSHNA